MRRHLLTLALTGLFGAFLTADAQACHKRKCTPACAPVVACAPAPVCEPCPPPAPVCEPVVCEVPKKKCSLFAGHKIKMGGLFHHKKAACAPAPVVCETAAYAPTWAPAPSPQVYATGQAHASGQ